MSIVISIPSAHTLLQDSASVVYKEHPDLQAPRLLFQSAAFVGNDQNSSGISTYSHNYTSDVIETAGTPRSVTFNSPTMNNKVSSIKDDDSNHSIVTKSPVATLLPISREFYLSDLWDSPSFAYSPSLGDDENDDYRNIYFKNRSNRLPRNTSYSSIETRNSEKGREEAIILRQLGTNTDTSVNSKQPYSFFSQIWRRPSAPTLLAPTSKSNVPLTSAYHPPRRYSLRIQSNDCSHNGAPSSVPSAAPSRASSDDSSVRVAELYRRYYQNTSYGVDDDSVLGGSNHDGEVRFNDDDSIHTVSNAGDLASSQGNPKDSEPSSPVIGVGLPALPFSFWRLSSSLNLASRRSSFGVEGLNSSSSTTVVGSSNSSKRPSANTSPNTSQRTSLDTQRKGSNNNISASVKPKNRHRYSKSMSAAIPYNAISGNNLSLSQPTPASRENILKQGQNYNGNDLIENTTKNPIIPSQLVTIPAAFYRTGIFLTVPSSITTQKRGKRGAPQKGVFTVYTILIRLLRPNLSLFNNASPASFTVYRRYREFRVFYREIVRKYSERIVGLPPFPKKSFFERLSPSTIQARQSAFATLLSFIALDQVLSNDPLLAQFLMLDFFPFSSLSRNNNNNLGGVVLREKDFPNIANLKRRSSR